MQRMSPLDASFLHIENDVNHMHIGSVAIFEGPPPAFDSLVAMIAGKLILVPRYRQIVRSVALDLGRPIWTDDAHFNINYHLRRSALPSPGGDVELRNLVGRVMSQQLDRARPLWEMWVVEGLDNGCWALLSKVHHSMVDGVSATDLLTVLLDSERDPGPVIEDPWTPERTPRDIELLANALAERASSPYEALRTVRAAVRAPRQYAARARDATRGLINMRGLLRPTPASTLNGPIGPYRRWSWARSQLSDVKKARAALGGTVNDIVLACITNGFRQLLLERGEPVDRVVRTLVPVSVRLPGERGSYNNRVSAVFAELPVGIDDPQQRLDAIRSQMKDLKQSKQAVAGEVLTSLGGFAPPVLLALGTRLGTRMSQRNVNTVTTNVPGPQLPLFAAGRRMLEAFPYVPIASQVRIGVAIFSYDGALNFGVTGDYDAAPDINTLCAGIESGLDELIRLTEATERSQPPKLSPPARPPTPAGKR